MSTPTITPDQSNTAPDVSIPQAAPPSVLGQSFAQPMPTLSANSPEEQQAAADGAAPAPGSRLLAILGAISRVASTGLSGIPDRGRPSFISGLGEGARAGIAANQQDQE